LLWNPFEKKAKEKVAFFGSGSRHSIKRKLRRNLLGNSNYE